MLSSADACPLVLNLPCLQVRVVDILKMAEKAKLDISFELPL
jgi:hypothetical protein